MPYKKQISRIADPQASYLIKPQKTWQLQTAKARFSELFRLVYSEGPQIITKQGKEAAVLLTLEEYEKLIAKQEKSSLVEFFRNSPFRQFELKIERDKDSGRSVRL